MNVLARWNDNRKVVHFKWFEKVAKRVLKRDNERNGTDIRYEIVQRDDNENDLYEIR